MGYTGIMLRLVYDPEDAHASLEGLYTTDPVLYNRVYDLIDALVEDPRRPAFPGHPKAMLDRDGEPLLGIAVRSPQGEVAVVWGVRTDDDGAVVKVAYIGENVLRL